jgi:hypothetical protein
MSGDQDTVVDLAGKFGVAELMRRTAAAREKEAAKPERPEDATESPLPSMDELSPLPVPGDPYKAFARPSGHMLPTLHLLTGDGQVFSFPYSGRVEGPHRLAVEGEPGMGAVLVLRFAASIAVEVLIAGTHLDGLHVYLAEHRIRWVRALPPRKMLKDDGSPVVRTLTVRPVQSRQAKGWPVAARAAGG